VNTKHSRKVPVAAPSDDELEELARKHIAFEVLALIDSLGLGVAGPTPRARHLGPGISRHLMASHDLLIHTRALAGFLACSEETCPGWRHRNDVEARHYAPHWGGRDVLGAEKDQIDKALAHISRKRPAVGKIPEAKRTELGFSVLRGLKKFFGELPNGRRAWFTQSEAAVREALSAEGARQGEDS